MVIWLNVRRNLPQSSNFWLNVRSSNKLTRLYCPGSGRYEAMSGNLYCVFSTEKYSVMRKRGRQVEVMSNIHPQFFGVNVRRSGPQPSLFVRSFSQITILVVFLFLVNSLKGDQILNGRVGNCSQSWESAVSCPGIRFPSGFILRHPVNWPISLLWEDAWRGTHVRSDSLALRELSSRLLHHPERVSQQQKRFFHTSTLFFLVTLATLKLLR